MPAPETITCSKCAARFTVSRDFFERRLSGKRVIIRCRQCGAHITIDAKDSASSAPKEPQAEPLGQPSIQLPSDSRPLMTAARPSSPKGAPQHRAVAPHASGSVSEKHPRVLPPDPGKKVSMAANLGKARALPPDPGKKAPTQAAQAPKPGALAPGPVKAFSTPPNPVKKGTLPSARAAVTAPLSVSPRTIRGVAPRDPPLAVSPIKAIGDPHALLRTETRSLVPQVPRPGRSPGVSALAKVSSSPSLRPAHAGPSLPEPFDTESQRLTMPLVPPPDLIREGASPSSVPADRHAPPAVEIVNAPRQGNVIEAVQADGPPASANRLPLEPTPVAYSVVNGAAPSPPPGRPEPMVEAPADPALRPRRRKWVWALGFVVFGSGLGAVALWMQHKAPGRISVFTSWRVASPHENVSTDKLNVSTDKLADQDNMQPATSAGPSAAAEPATAESGTLPDAGSDVGPGNVPAGVNPLVVEHRTRAVLARAQRCHLGGRATGTARVFFTFDSTGKVEAARIEGEPIASAPVAECILIHARSLIIPKYDGPSFTVSRPITLR